MKSRCETALPACVWFYRMESSHGTCVWVSLYERVSISNSVNTHALHGQKCSPLIWLSVSCWAAFSLCASLSNSVSFFKELHPTPTFHLLPLFLLLLDFSSPNGRNTFLGRIGNPLLNGFFDKRKVCYTQQMVRGEWIRAAVVQNKRHF